MSVLDDLLKKHRARIIAREEAAFREILDAYTQVKKELLRQIRELQAKITEAQKSGVEMSRSWLLTENRLQSMIDQIKTQIEIFGGKAANVTTREQEAAIRIALEQTRETVTAITGITSPAARQIGAMLIPRVVENAIGIMGDGSPILEYYAKNLAPKVVELIRSEVINAAATGTPFKNIANRLVQTGQITKTRALAVARTEVNRVRRETTRQIYIENPFITAWRWTASLSPRTCPVCLALDGRIFPLVEPFPQHINCRCTMVPIIEGVDDLVRQVGAEWFEEQTDEIKEMILGKDAFAAYKRGEVTLKDFIGWKNSKEFGKSVYTRPLSAILMNKK